MMYCICAAPLIVSTLVNQPQSSMVCPLVDHRNKVKGIGRIDTLGMKFM